MQHLRPPEREALHLVGDPPRGPLYRDRGRRGRDCVRTRCLDGTCGQSPSRRGAAGVLHRDASWCSMRTAVRGGDAQGSRWSCTPVHPRTLHGDIRARLHADRGARETDFGVAALVSGSSGPRARHWVHASSRSPLPLVSSNTRPAPECSRSLALRPSVSRSKPVPRSAYRTAGPFTLKNHIGTSARKAVARSPDTRVRATVRAVRHADRKTHAEPIVPRRPSAPVVLWSRPGRAPPRTIAVRP